MSQSICPWIPFIADGDTLKLDPDDLEIENKPCVAFLHVVLFRPMVVPVSSELNDLTKKFSTLKVP